MGASVIEREVPGTSLVRAQDRFEWVRSIREQSFAWFLPLANEKLRWLWEKVELLDLMLGELEKLLWGKAETWQRPDTPLLRAQRALGDVEDDASPHAKRDKLSTLFRRALPDGVPYAIEGYDLVLHPRHPLRTRQDELLILSFGSQSARKKYRKRNEARRRKNFREHLALAMQGFHVRNQWYSKRERRTVVIAELAGRIHKRIYEQEGPSPAHAQLGLLMNTFVSAAVWSLQAEERSLQLLKALIPEEMYERYMMTGMFVSISARSGVLYLFRRNRPTLAFNRTGHFLTALCLHPTGFYAETYAGVLCPTDDVIAHYLLATADEHRLWKKAVHHPIYDVRAGIG